MTVDEAHAVWEPHREGGDEGWLDIAARIEQRRPLTIPEVMAADLLWAEFVAAMANVAVTRTVTRTEPVERRG